VPQSVDVTIPSDREIVVTRIFEAPRALIWDCHTRPALVRRWLLGPTGWTMPVCEIDLRVGGKYRYVWRKHDGRELVSHGEHREIHAPERLVTTEQMQGFEGASVNTMVLREAGGRTTLTLTMLFPTTDARDGALRSGMSDGIAASYDRLQAIADEQKVS
jgi:uncharacterized protein YndB with AHSA1/START domain